MDRRSDAPVSRVPNSDSKDRIVGNMALTGSQENPDDTDVIAEARRAARRAGMTLGEWLDAMVDARSGGPAPSAPPPAPRSTPAESIAAINARLDSLERRGSLRTRGAAEPRRAVVESQVSRDLVRKLEERLEALSRRMEHGEPEPQAPMPPMPPSPVVDEYDDRTDMARDLVRRTRGAAGDDVAPHG